MDNQQAPPQQIGTSKTLTLAEVYSQAITHFNASRYPETEQLCNAILQRVPDHIDSINLLGVVAQKVNRHDLAIEQFQQAMEIAGNSPVLQRNLGISLHSLGRLAEAIAAFQLGLRKDPKNPLLLCDLGTAFEHSEQLEAAIECYQEAISLQPDYAIAHNNLGNIYTKQGNFKAAIACLQQAVTLEPDYAEAHNNLGLAMTYQGAWEESISQYEKAIVLNPDFYKAYFNLGNSLSRVGKLELAIVNYNKALAINPRFVDALNNCGNALGAFGGIEQAIACFKQAIAINPKLVETYNNYGNILTEQGKLDEAAACYRQAIAVNPDRAEAYNNYGNVLKDQGNLDAAIANYKKAATISPSYTEAGDNVLLAMNYGTFSADKIFNQYGLWQAALAEDCRTFSEDDHRDPSANRELRIGFVSGDLRKHSVSYFLEPFFHAHDRQKMTFYCYSNSLHEDAVSRRLASMVAGWRNIIACDDQTVAAMIIADRIDILVDLSGHTRHNRLAVFAKKPAPIQVTWLGYPDTTGLEAMDYRLSDQIADPPGLTDEFHTEKLVRLPKGFLCYQPPDSPPDIGPLPLKAKGHVTFASFNNMAKITPEVIAVWIKILQALPDSKLLLKSKTMNCPGVRRRFLDLFSKESVDSSRLILLRRTASTTDHLAKYGRADIALDTFPYNGTTTTCEALWMGVPVVTLVGNRHAGRVGASLLSSVGLPQLIADDIDDYIERTVTLAKDVAQLEKMRLELRNRVQTSSLCDSKGFSLQMEQAFRKMWREWTLPKEQG